MALGARIREIRLKLGLTQSQLAESIGKAQSYVQSLENRDSRKTDHLDRLSNVLKVTPGWLATGKGEKHPVSATLKATSALTATPDIEKIMQVASDRSLEYLEIIKQAAKKGKITEDMETMLKAIADKYKE